MYSLTSRRVRVTIVVVEKQYVLHSLSMRGCILSLFIQLAKRVHHIVSSSVACTAEQYFNTLFDELHDFRKKVTEHKICVFILSTDLSEIFLILRKHL